MIRHFCTSALALGLTLGLGLGQTGLARAQDQGPQFRLNAIDTGSSHYLRPDDVAAVTGRYLNRPLVFDDLQKMMGELQGLYVTAGVPTAQAVLPPQDILGGRLRVSLVEAQIEAVRITDASHTDPAFFTRNLTLPLGAKPDFAQIERDLKIFGLSHDLMPVLDFSAGAETGGTVVTIAANEPENLTYTAGLDNFGRAETGRIRANLSANWASLTGWRDHLSLQATRSGGAWSGSAGYDRPMGPNGGRGYVQGYVSKSQVTGGAFSDANIVSDGQGISLGYRLPLIAEFDRSLMAQFGFGIDRTQSTIAGITFADTDLQELTAELAYQAQLPLTQWGGTAVLKLGRSQSVGGALSDGSFGVLRGNLWVTRQVAKDLALSLNAEAQLSSRLQLPISRQMSVGGLQSLRGYPLDVRSVPDALVLRLQASKITPWRLGKSGLDLQPFAFFDAAVLGAAREQGSRIGPDEKLASVGFGASMQWGGTYGLQALVGLPLRSTSGFDKSQGASFYLGLSATF